MLRRLSEAFSDLIRRYRLAARLTQADLAERAGLSREAISALERGVRQTPRRDTLQLLGDALGLDSADRAALAGAAPSRARVVSGHWQLTNLRLTASPPIGREHELAQARTLLEREDVRLLTLTGPVGVGKTHLALAIARTEMEQFVDGVVVASLVEV